MLSVSPASPMSLPMHAHRSEAPAAPLCDVKLSETVGHFLFPTSNFDDDLFCPSDHSDHYVVEPASSNP